MKKKLRIKDATLDQLNNFSFFADAIRDMISKYWSGTLAPKGYKEYRKNYEEYDDMDDEGFHMEFNGLGGGSVCASSIETQLNMPHVAYSDVGQGRKPIETLIGTILGYGMMIGKARAKKEADLEFERLEKNTIRNLKWLDKEDINKEVKDGLIKCIKEDMDYFKRFAIKYD